MSGFDTVSPSDEGRRAFLLGLASASAAVLLPASLLASPQATLRVQRLAWAGIRVQLPDATLFVDPLTNPDAWGAALPDKLVSVDDAVGDTSVLITHSHSDHYDIGAAASALRRGGVLAHPIGIPPLSLPQGSRARPSPLWEPQLLGDFTATPVPAADGYGDAQVSWIVAAGGRRIFHGGDTLWHGHWWRIGRQFGPFDAAFLPVNGARFGWRKPASDQPGVLTPEQAVAAADILGAKVLVPIHYGVTGMKEYVEIPDPIGELHRAAGKRSIHVNALAPGDWLDWPA
ncbi:MULTISPECIES: MBL fold metallo-hydrolase [Stenotrophomonas maltophilia group]|uniref:MBL fold metallo-hydrolase n=1 Tax=Stenotrophomonas maltophilia group TaxID=995085 RepID=UPI0007F035AC|nr:MBL fold metallo-hydrolase [Stenotrophomonas maltophilia]MDT3501986.1 MBL fold metallo-hydrolase [Stenotrophomonas maltophilia]OBU51197.1 Zn-dependent hydrolase [Stenotrophomonas maltophilia]